jgi:Leucine-rich repeat (LRR) protein
LPAAIVDLPKLKALSLASNVGLGPGLADLCSQAGQASDREAQLDQHHQQHRRLRDLCVLSLEHTELSVLPPLVWQATSLTALSLEHNRLATLPAELAQLRRLKVHR